MSILTPEAAQERIAKLNEKKAALIQAANAQLAPLEGQAFQIAEQKAVIVGNANLEVGKIDGQLAILTELFPQHADKPTGPVPVPPPQE